MSETKTKNKHKKIKFFADNSSEPNFQIKNFWFYLSRILTALTFSGILVLVNILHFKTLPISSLLIFILLYAIWNITIYFFDKIGLYFYMLASDVLFSSFLVYSTGSHSSQFQFIFILIIIFAGFYLSKERLYLLSSFVIVVYSTILNLEYFKLIPTHAQTNLSSYGLSYYIGIHFIAIFLTSIVINKISEKLLLLTGQIKLKEKKLKDLMTIKNRIVDTIPSCMIMTNRDFSITFINGNAKTFFEKQNQTSPLPGDYLNSFIPTDLLVKSKDKVLSRAEYTFETGEVIGFTISQMYSGNSFDGILILFQDLTELKKLEKRVLFKNNLETLGEMAAGIAHEIRNPLASITGSVQLLQETKTNEDDKELLTVIADELKRIDESVNNLLVFANNDNQDSKKENINKIIKDVLILFEKGLNENFILVVDKEQIEKKSLAFCKKGRIKQVLWNILKNAEKAIEYCKVKKIFITSETENDYVIISIRDTGIGISEHDIDNIFNPYFSKFAKGFGLGLSICKEIIEEIDGKIEVLSTLNAGTCFNIYIPLKQAIGNKHVK